MGSDGLFCLSSICKFQSFKKPIATNTSLSELTSDLEDLFCWFKFKKMNSINYDESTSSWKPWRWVSFGLILTMRDIYIHSNLNPLTKFPSRSRSFWFKYIFPWNISQTIMKTVPISTRIVIRYAMKRGILFWIFWEVNGNWENNNQNFPMKGERLCGTDTSVRRKKEIQKSRTLRVTVRDPSTKVNHLSKVIWDEKIITEFTRSISFTRIGQQVLMLDFKVSKDKHTSRWVDWENLLYVWWNQIENHT